MKSKLKPVDLSTIRWWTHPEEFDWTEWERGEKARWVATPIEEKKLELIEQKIAEGKNLTSEEFVLLERA